MQRDPYEVLGVERGADDKEIRKAFRSLARELHPDVNPDPSAEGRFKELAEAYEILSDSDRRATFDRYGHEGLSGQGWSPGFESFGSFGDLFSAFFGGGRASGPRQGSDLGIAVDLSLDEAFSGVGRVLEYDSIARCETCSGDGCEPGTALTDCSQCRGAGAIRAVQRSPFGQIVSETACPKCKGRGRSPEVPCGDCLGEGAVAGRRSVEVEIPAGIADGQRVRVAGRGNAGQAGGPPGDLYVVVQVADDERFLRDGDDLICVIDVSIAKAALGTSIELEGIDGAVEVDLPAGTQPGTVISISDRGMPSLRGRRRGDLKAVVNVHVPEHLDDRQTAALEDLARSLPDSPQRRESLMDRVRGALGGAFGGR